MRAFGIICSSGNHIHVEGMQDYRSIGAFSFLGRYRAIDFPMSNMSNSDIEHVAVLCGNNPRSLVEHLGSGRHYNINSKRGKVQLLFTEGGAATSFYNTNMAGFAQNLESIQKAPADYVVIAPGYMIYTQDYDKLLDQHIDSGADITLLYHAIDTAHEDYLNCDTLTLNRQNGVTNFVRNRGAEESANIFMDTYVMKKSLFIELILKARSISSMYTLAQIVNSCCGELDIRGVEHKGYFATLTDFKSIYKANMSLIDYQSAKLLFNDKWPIYTRTSDTCPTQYFDEAEVKSSVVANGCLIQGNLENCVIGRDVKIGKNCVIKNCVISSDVIIADGTHLENLIVDKHARVLHTKELAATPENPGYVKRGDNI